jgi:hypothetical protein
MNVGATLVITMPPALTTKVLLFVSVMLGILEMDLIVLVGKSFIDVWQIFYPPVSYIMFAFFIIFCRH